MSPLLASPQKVARLWNSHFLHLLTAFSVPGLNVVTPSPTPVLLRNFLGAFFWGAINLALNHVMSSRSSGGNQLSIALQSMGGIRLL